jgi:hypothetical protein
VSVPVLVAAEDAAPAASPAPDSTEPAAESHGGGWSRGTAHTLGLVAGGLGIVGLGLGTAFAVDASSKKSSYQQHETNGHCSDPQCATLSQSALSSANVSTVAFIAGGVLLATGAVLWLTAPAAPAESTEGTGVAFVPMAGPDGVGAGVWGRF